MKQRNRRLQWGLAARLPRWRAFDGRRSRVAVNWTRSTTDINVPTNGRRRSKEKGRSYEHGVDHTIS
jgi:hypothetical protein